MRSKNVEPQIIGNLFRLCFTSEEEFENGYKQSEFYVEGDYMSEYRKHLVAMTHISEIAKSYILNNYQKIENWIGLNVKVIDGRNEEFVEYYNHKERNFSRRRMNENYLKLFEEMNQRSKERHNPITSLTDVVLDPTDGDFSLTINGKEFYWIQDEAVIIIADYIEKQLKNVEK